MNLKKLDAVEPVAVDTVEPVALDSVNRWGEGERHHRDAARQHKYQVQRIERGAGSLKPEALELAKKHRNVAFMHEDAAEAWKAANMAWRKNDPEAGNYEDEAAALGVSANRMSSELGL